MTQGENARAAALLREYRREAGLSQRRLAELAQVSIGDALWGDDIPATAVHLAQVYVNRLRRLLDPGRLLTSAGTSYELVAGEGQVDLMVFEEHASHARRAQAAGELGPACEAYARAFGTWRAEPFADIEILHAHPAVVALCQHRSDLVIRYAEAATAAGRQAEVLPWLRELAAAEPLNERAHAALMLALAGSGQQAAALALFDDLRRRLDDQLGVRPGAELADAQQRVLRQDVPQNPGRGLPDSGQQGGGSAGTGPLAPRQLPATVPDFAGRTDEFAALTKALDGGGAGRRGRIIAVTGVAGVGKTTLAVHWAQQAARCFPDGQLYVNLRGFDPSGAPVAAADAVRGFLMALSVPAEMIPVAADAQAGLYRSLLADKRMLVVLDNARDPAQVRPLLPGSAGCLAVVTSRSLLAGLVAAEGARQLSLDVLTDAEAAELLTGRLGQDRTRGEPEALAELIALCAGLPIALVIVAARAIAQQHLPLRMLAAELRGAKNRLDTLTTGDSATDVRSVFSWSYLGLPAPAARLFRLAGLHPGPSLSAEAAASLAGLPLSAAERWLRELVSAGLIDEHAPGRFALHDLLREYAAERAKSTGTQVSRRAAMHRMLDHYLHTALAAGTLLDQEQPWIGPPRIARGVTLGRFAGHRAAANWFETEHLALMAMITLAADLALDLHACQLAVSLAGVLDQSACWEDLAASSATVVAAAQRADHREAEAYAQRGLGGAFARLGRYSDAYVHLQRCLDQFTELENIDGQARAHLNLACLLHFMDDSERALSHAHRARELFGLLQQDAGLAASLNTVGWSEAQQGRKQQGLAYCQQALALAQEIDNPVIAAATWDSLGYVRHACAPNSLTQRKWASGHRADGNRRSPQPGLVRSAGPAAGPFRVFGAGLARLDRACGVKMAGGPCAGRLASARAGGHR